MKCIFETWPGYHRYLERPGSRGFLELTFGCKTLLYSKKVLRTRSEINDDADYKALPAAVRCKDVLTTETDYITCGQQASLKDLFRGTGQQPALATGLIVASKPALRQLRTATMLLHYQEMMATGNLIIETTQRQTAHRKMRKALLTRERKAWCFHFGPVAGVLPIS